VTLITVIISFVLTGLIGNYFVQRWQQRNWHEQHRVLRLEKELDELRTLINEIMELGDARNYRARRLLLSLDNESSISTERLMDYERTVAVWNDRFNSFCVRLTLLASGRWPDSGEEDGMRM